MSNKAILKRLKKVEGVFHAGEPRDDWVDFCMWDVSGGVFGHVHYRFSESRGESLRTPCSDEEELEIMRAQYEDEGHRLCGKGEEVSFAEYLERLSYLCPEALRERQKLVIERVRGEENLA
jgi:hypothetical protein